MQRERYRLLEQLGEGGMGTVFRAYDRLTGQMVALKRVVASAEQLQFTTRSAEEDLGLALAKEFQALASLRHPNIISVLDYGFDEQGLPYFTMELLDRPQTILDAGRNQPLDRQVDLLAQVLHALVYLHRRGILHRDLKPSNVLVVNGRVRLVDFGLAVEMTQTSDIGGTLAYIAPEILDRQAASPSADLYAVGVIAYELFAGRHPFEDADLAAMMERITHDPPDLGPIPKPLTTIIQRLLAKSPEARYTDAYRVLLAISNATEQSLRLETTAIRESFLQAARLVGRESELGMLLDSLKQAVAGWGSAWLISGESGVGKSRLLNELRSRALVSGVLVLRGQGMSGGGLSYQLWREPMRRLALSIDLSDFEASVLKALVPDIGALIEREVEDLPELHSSAQHRRLALTILDVLRRIQKPTLLLVEDLQWTNESLRILSQVTPLAARLPLMIVGTYRDDDCPELPIPLPETRHVRLKRLSPEAIAELSASMLGETGKRPHVVNLLRRETEGNAFFLVEVARTLAEASGSLMEVGSATIPDRVFAGGVQQVIRRRLDRVSAPARPLLKCAAIAGRQLDLDLLRVIARKLHTSQGLDSWLMTCSNAAVIELQDGHWRFAHDKLREALIDDLQADERIRLYRIVAEGFEAVYSKSEGRGSQLADLWRVAENPVKELEYAYLSSKQSIHVSEHAEGQKWCERALAILQQGAIQNETERQHWRVTLQILLGELYAVQSDYSRAKTTLRSGLEMARAINQLPKVADALGQLGRIAYWEGDYLTGTAYLLEALDIARQLSDLSANIYTLRQLGNIANAEGNYDEAETYLQDSFTLAKNIADRVSMARALNSLGNTESGRGNLGKAVVYFEDALAMCRAVGDRAGIGIQTGNLGITHYKLGNFDVAARFSREALQVGREINNSSLVANSHVNLGMVAVAQGETQQAHAHFVEALTICRATGDLPNLTSAIAGYAYLRFRLGRSGAVELLTFAMHHPASTDETRQRCDKLLIACYDRMHADEIAGALARGRALDPDAAANFALAEDG